MDEMEVRLNWLSLWSRGEPVSSDTKGYEGHELMSLEQLWDDSPWPQEGVLPLPRGWSGDMVVQFEKNDEGPYVLVVRQHAPGFDWHMTKGWPNGPMPVRIYGGNQDRDVTLELATWPLRNENPYMGSVPFIMMPRFSYQRDTETGVALVFERIKVVGPHPRPGHGYINLPVARVNITIHR